MPSATDIIKQMLKYLLDPSDKDRAFVTFNPNDNVVMLVNNFGGLSGLELEALTDLALKVLKSDWNIVPQRIYAGIMETSLNGQGFSITLGNMTGMARAMSISDSEIFSLLDAPTNAPAWPKNNYVPVDVSAEMQDRRDAAQAAFNAPSRSDTGPATPPALITALKAACKAGLEAEPTITQYDLQMGDGDCGEAVAGLCNAILSHLSDSPPPLLTLLSEISESVEDVGGSLGAILSILLTAFINALSALTSSQNVELNVETVAQAAEQALDNLKNYTSAREGDRTVMDVLIPFIETLAKGKDFEGAVKVAGEKAEGTGGMKAKFGRATYISDEGSERGRIPDPGAYAAGVWLKGLLEGFRG